MESELKRKLEKLETIVGVNKIIAHGDHSVKAIKRYFKVNHFAYKKFHSDRGFMHFRVSKNGKIETDDVYYQPDVVSKYIPKGAKVVELGSGQGSNLCYLAKKHEDAFFTGYDLQPVKLKKGAPKNLRIIRGNYSDMKEIESGTIDVVYGVETVVYCSDKEVVFNEVRRILKSGGVFIVYDYATPKPFESYAPYEKTAIDLISVCGASARIESDEEWDNHFKNCGFERISKTDLHEETMPDLYRLMRKASKVVEVKRRANFVFKFLPATFTGNVIIGYLGADACKEGLFYYNEWIYRKHGN